MKQTKIFEICPNFFVQLCVLVRPSIKMKISLYFLLLLRNSGRFSLPRYLAEEIRSLPEKSNISTINKAKQRHTNSPNRENMTPKSTRLDCRIWINKHIWKRKYQLIESQSTRKAYKKRFVAANIGSACSSPVQEGGRFGRQSTLSRWDRTASLPWGWMWGMETQRIWRHHWSITSYNPCPKADATRFLSWYILNFSFYDWEPSGFVKIFMSEN